jgi:hypothetical protein
LPASFFSGALLAVAGALEAGFLSAALGGIFAILVGLKRNRLMHGSEYACLKWSRTRVRQQVVMKVDGGGRNIGGWAGLL